MVATQTIFILERNAPLVQTLPTFSFGSMNSQSDNLGFWVIQSFQLFNWFILIMDLNSTSNEPLEKLKDPYDHFESLWTQMRTGKV